MERGSWACLRRRAAAASSCPAASSTTAATNLVNGKTLFVAECAACHTLARAGATGVTGPNLDAAFPSPARTV